MQVLYITGAGRSGSTLLELILGNLPLFFSVGEVRFFWEYWTVPTRLCGCGQSLQECVAWQRVMACLDTDVPLSIPALADQAARLDRTHNLPWLTASLHTDRKPPPEFIDATRRLYAAIWEASGHRIIVDSSKVPSHLFMLAQVPEIDLRVLHLVRDGRAVSHSWSKRRKQELGVSTARARMPHRSELQAMLVWAIENIYARRLGQRQARYTVMRYEDFARNPAQELARSLDALDIHGVDLSLLRQPTLTLQPTHSVGGNPLRFTQRAFTIKLDQAWQRQMPPRLQMTLGIPFAPVLHRYGYRVRPEAG